MPTGISRKAESSALFALLQRAYAWKFSAKTARAFSNIARMDMPAMILWLPNESRSRSGSVPVLPIRVRKYRLSIYLRDGMPPDPNNTIQDQIDDILDGVDNAIAAMTPNGSAKDPNMPQTLSDPNQVPLVTDCWIEGDVPINPAVIDQSAVLHIPIFARTGR